MKKITLSLALSCAAISSQAACFGSGAFQTCSDNEGNHYNVQRFGNTTTMQGSNTANGTTWNQTSNTMGNTTYQNGTASNGQSWNGTTTSLPGMQVQQGTDSRGNSYHRTCTATGCY